MTETPDPRATFAADQAAAQSEAESREAATWAHQVRLGELNLEQIQANAWAIAALAGRRHAEAKAIALLSLGALPMMAAAAVRLVLRRKA